MKFGKTFEQSFVDDQLPAEWHGSAIQYKQLKKHIKCVVEEIKDEGLSEQIHSERLHYVFQKHEDQLDKKIMDETDHSCPIKLKSDEVFFQNLYSQSRQLSTLQRQEEKRLLQSIQQFSRVIITLTSNTKDKYKWREIFNLYIDFKLNLNTHFTKKTMGEFLDHFNSLKINLNKKQTAIFDSFMDLNYDLLHFQTYQSLNNIAITKILKKFNKNTLLNPSNLRPLLQASTTTIDPFAMEQIISKDIITLVPQVDDYLCPICFQLAYKPIRLTCSHFFCLRCMIQLQRRAETKCPICRDPNVMLADENSVDEDLIALMKKEFPRELKIKKRQNDKEITEEAVEELRGKKCVIM